MIYYRPTDGDPYMGRVEYRPKTCFIMTKLGQPIPQEVTRIRSRLQKIFRGYDIKTIDANDQITGKDFLMKIWHIILGVPLGIAIITQKMSQLTYANIFYEIGLMQAYGKETLVIKGEDTTIPSDFVRTEYIEFTKGFSGKINKYLNRFFSLAAYYENMAEQIENNPLLAIDYYKRAWLITGNNFYKEKAIAMFNSADIQGRAKNSVEMLLVDFCKA
jgi:hypothetical protein